MFNYENNKMRFCFDEKKGQITELVYMEKSFVFCRTSIFEIAERDEMGRVHKTTAMDYRMEHIDTYDNGFRCVYENDDKSVEVAADITDKISWRISVKNRSNRVIEWVNFPQIIVENDLRGTDDGSKILWGFNEGAVVDSMEFRNSLFGYIEPEYPSKGLIGMFPAVVELQCMAYYDKNCGLYFAAHDNSENLKGIDFYECDGGIKLQFRHFTGCDFGQDYEMTYPMIMQFFKGDWMTAASIYRTWFEENKSNEFIPIENNGKLPKWYRESPVVVTYPVRGAFDTDKMNPNKMFPYCNAVKYIEKLEKLFDSKIMVILMHWEGTAPWAPPIVWPPYGGEEEFTKFVKMLHERDDCIGVYCSGLGWTQKSNLTDYDMSEFFEKEKLERYMCLSPEQTLPYSNICTDQRVGYDMCPTQKFTTDIICDQVNKMAASGVDYIQLMDQNHGGTSYFCYSKEHGHPPVPGKWQVEAVKKLLKTAEMNTGKILFGCESAAAESYIPQLLFSDNRYNLCYGIGEPVPLYSFVYHKYLNNFMGNQVCAQYVFDHEKSPENIFVRIAYSFCSGDMLTAVINDEGKITFNWGYCGGLPDMGKTAKLINNLNYWRRCKGQKYLNTGTMQIPYKTSSAKVKLYGSEGFDHEYDSVFTSAWTAPDGTFGQFLVNHTDKPAECEVLLPENESFAVYGRNSEILMRASGKSCIRIDELSAVLIEKV